MKTCAYVGKGRGVPPHDFEPDFYHRKYCSEAHQIAARNARNMAERRIKRPVPSVTTCAYVDESRGIPPHDFEPKYSYHVYCTEAHQQAARNARRVAERKRPVVPKRKRCQYRAKGVEPHWFTPTERIGKDGKSRGVFPRQKYCCEAHRLAAGHQRWVKKHPDKAKAGDTRGTERKRKLIALGREAEAAKPAARPLEKVTKARIRLAAYHQLGGLTAYPMTDSLFPPKPDLPDREKSADRERRFDSTKKLLKKHKIRIAEESQRQVLLPPAERDAIAADARAFIHSSLSLP